MKSKFQSTEYALLIYAADGRKITGTGYIGDLGRAKSQTPAAAYVDVKPFVKGQSQDQAKVLVRISEKGQTVPQSEEGV